MKVKKIEPDQVFDYLKHNKEVACVNFGEHKRMAEVTVKCLSSYPVSIVLKLTRNENNQFFVRDEEKEG